MHIANFNDLNCQLRSDQEKVKIVPYCSVPCDIFIVGKVQMFFPEIFHVDDILARSVTSNFSELLYCELLCDFSGKDL